MTKDGEQEATNQQSATAAEEVDGAVKSDADVHPTVATAAVAVVVEAAKEARSVFLTGFGGPKYVRVLTKEQRPVGKGEVAVEVEACGVGFQDLMTRQGLLEYLGKPPFIMGSECTGRIAEVGEGVTQFKAGDEVIVLCDGGTWTEHLVVRPLMEDGSQQEGEQAETTGGTNNAAAPSALVLHRPKELSINQAAVFLMSYLPAYILLHDVACVRPGDIVLVHSAGGGVGTAIGQLARHIGNVTMIGTASTDKHEKLQPYYSKLFSICQDYVSEVKKEFPRGVTVVLDSRSGEDTNKSLSLLQSLGRYIIYGSSSFVTGERKNLFSFAKSWIQMDRISPLKLLEENKILGGFSLKQMMFRQGSNHSVVFKAWKELQQLLVEGKIEPIVDSEWSFEEVKEALHKLQDRKNFGKVVISPKLKSKDPKTGQKSTEEGNEETTSPEEKVDEPTDSTSPPNTSSSP